MENPKLIQLAGSAIIVDNKLLLLYKIKYQHYEFPGGKVEAGESIEDTAQRETKEEIGCDVKFIKYLGHIDFHHDSRDFQSHFFLAEIPPNQSPQITEPEIFRDHIWIPMNEYRNYTLAPNAIEFCERYHDGEIKKF